jgi:DNA-binding transcriptional LysR family regulator
LDIAEFRTTNIQIRMNEMDWNQARAFCATAASGSLSAAARKLGLTQPTLSRQVAALEAALGTTLFERIGKRLVLTDTGLSLVEHARAMSTAAEAMALAAAGKSQDIQGRVTISATDAVSAYLLPGLLARVRVMAPQITLAIVASDSISDLRKREADIAIRHVRPTESELVAKLVGEMTAHFYAADSWIAKNGKPESVAQLCACEVLGFEPIEQFSGHLRAAGIPISADQFRIVSDNSVVLWEMARQGIGICMMLQEIAERIPNVVRLLPELPGTSVPVWLVSHRELHTSRRVRLVFDLLAEELSRGSSGEGRIRPQST